MVLVRLVLLVAVVVEVVTWEEILVMGVGMGGSRFASLVIAVGVGLVLSIGVGAVVGAVVAVLAVVSKVKLVGVASVEALVVVVSLVELVVVASSVAVVVEVTVLNPRLVFPVGKGPLIPDLNDI